MSTARACLRPVPLPVEPPPPVDLSLLTLLRRDLARYQEFHRHAERDVSRARIAIESVLFKAGFQAVLLYRLSHWCVAHHVTWIAWAIARVNQMMTGADIDSSAQIGPGLLIAHPAGVVIGCGTIIGAHATLYQGVACGIRNWGTGRGRLHPHIGHHCVLFARATVLGGIRVGHRSIIAAHALVTHDVPDGSLAEGTPLQIKRGLGDRILKRWGL